VRPHQVVKRQIPGASNDQGKHAARNGEILFEMQQLVLVGEIGVEQYRGQQAEYPQRQSAKAGVKAKSNGNASTDLQAVRSHRVLP
jgi:hypothetical protein